MVPAALSAAMPERAVLAGRRCTLGLASCCFNHVAGVASWRGQCPLLPGEEDTGEENTEALLLLHRSDRHGLGNGKRYLLYVNCASIYEIRMLANISVQFLHP